MLTSESSSRPQGTKSLNGQTQTKGQEGSKQFIVLSTAFPNSVLPNRYLGSPLDCWLAIMQQDQILERLQIKSFRVPAYIHSPSYTINPSSYRFSDDFLV